MNNWYRGYWTRTRIMANSLRRLFWRSSLPEDLDEDAYPLLAEALLHRAVRVRAAKISPTPDLHDSHDDLKTKLGRWLRPRSWINPVWKEERYPAGIADVLGGQWFGECGNTRVSKVLQLFERLPHARFILLPYESAHVFVFTTTPLYRGRDTLDNSSAYLFGSAAPCEWCGGNGAHHKCKACEQPGCSQCLRFRVCQRCLSSPPEAFNPDTGRLLDEPVEECKCKTR